LFQSPKASILQRIHKTTTFHKIKDPLNDHFYLQKEHITFVGYLWILNLQNTLRTEHVLDVFQPQFAVIYQAQKNETKRFGRIFQDLSNDTKFKKFDSIVISMLLYKYRLVESPLVWQKNDGVRLDCSSLLCQRSRWWNQLISFHKLPWSVLLLLSTWILVVPIALIFFEFLKEMVLLFKSLTCMPYVQYPLKTFATPIFDLHEFLPKFDLFGRIFQN